MTLPNSYTFPKFHEMENVVVEWDYFDSFRQMAGDVFYAIQTKNSTRETSSPLVQIIYASSSLLVYFSGSRVRMGSLTWEEGGLVNFLNFPDSHGLECHSI